MTASSRQPSGTPMKKTPENLGQKERRGDSTLLNLIFELEEAERKSLSGKGPLPQRESSSFLSMLSYDISLVRKLLVLENEDFKELGQLMNLGNITQFKGKIRAEWFKTKDMQ